MTGKRTLDNILLILSFVAGMATVGVFVYSNFIFKRPLPGNEEYEAELLREGKKLSLAEAHKVDRLVINLPSRTGRLRFLEVQIHMVPFRPETLPLLQQRKAEIHDAAIQTAGAMGPEELNSLSGKILLESRLKKRVNDLMNYQAIKEILFDKFVVQ